MARKHMKYTAEHEAFIRANQYGISREELAKRFNAEFGTCVTKEQMRAACKNRGLKNGKSGRFKKGHVPWITGKKGYRTTNSGCFKKGHIPHNHKPVGHERTTKDGYIVIKTAEPNKFELKHRAVWRKHRGEIPESHCLRFLDNDKTNCDIDNLMLIPRSVNATTNKGIGANTGNAELNKAILLTETLKRKVNEVTNG